MSANSDVWILVARIRARVVATTRTDYKRDYGLSLWSDYKRTRVDANPMTQSQIGTQVTNWTARVVFARLFEDSSLSLLTPIGGMGRLYATTTTKLDKRNLSPVSTDPLGQYTMQIGGQKASPM